jgi:hypothetical protein
MAELPTVYVKPGLKQATTSSKETNYWAKVDYESFLERAFQWGWKITFEKECDKINRSTPLFPLPSLGLHMETSCICKLNLNRSGHYCSQPVEVTQRESQRTGRVSIVKTVFQVVLLTVLCLFTGSARKQCKLNTEMWLILTYRVITREKTHTT